MEQLLTILARPENAVFLVPALVAVLFMVLQIVGGGLDAAGGHGHGFDHSHGGGHHHDVGGHGHHHPHGHDHHDHAHHGHPHTHVDPRPGLFSSILTWLNIGRAPFMIVLEILLLAFGAFGVAGTSALRAHDGTQGGLAVAITFLPALIAAAFTAKVAGGLIGRYMPTFETKGSTALSLVGLTAEVASEEVTLETGRASARDAAGDLYTVFCRLSPGSPPAKRGEKVILVGYTADGDRYTVKPVAAAPEGAAAKP